MHQPSRRSSNIPNMGTESEIWDEVSSSAENTRQQLRCGSSYTKLAPSFAEILLSPEVESRGARSQKMTKPAITGCSKIRRPAKSLPSSLRSYDSTENPDTTR